jgi:hypothetical protein
LGTCAGVVSARARVRMRSFMLEGLGVIGLPEVSVERVSFTGPKLSFRVVARVGAFLRQGESFKIFGFDLLRCLHGVVRVVVVVS